MERDTITMKEILAIMDKGIPFDMDVVTCDMRRGTAGEIKSFTKVFLTHNVSKQGNKVYKATLANMDIREKKPHHYANSTRNIYDNKKPAHERIRKVHLRLIIKFNGKKVV